MRDQMKLSELEQLVWTKIRQQWKTIKKAYRDLSNSEATGISAAQLRNQFSHWGLNMTDEQFHPIFNKFDLDNDGIINYIDFLQSVGKECFPREGLYFRQDVPKPNKSYTCKANRCFHRPVGATNYCNVHIKIFREKAIQIMLEWKNKIADWDKFMQTVREKSDKYDKNHIKKEDLFDIVA